MKVHKAFEDRKYLHEKFSNYWLNANKVQSTDDHESDFTKMIDLISKIQCNRVHFKIRVGGKRYSMRYKTGLIPAVQKVPCLHLKFVEEDNNIIMHYMIKHQLDADQDNLGSIDNFVQEYIRWKLENA